MIKKKSCGISMSLVFWSWNFHGVSHSFVWTFVFSKISKSKVTNLKIPFPCLDFSWNKPINLAMPLKRLHSIVIQAKNGLFQKKKQTEGRWLRIYFFNPLEFLGFLLYPWKFQTKLKTSPLETSQNCVTTPSSEILTPKTKTPGNSTWFFLDHPRKFHIVFN